MAASGVPGGRLDDGVGVGGGGPLRASAPPAAASSEASG